MRAAALAGGATLLLALAAAASAGDQRRSATTASGDATRGAVAYQKCYSCHATEPGRNDLSGPTLHAIAGRRIAAEPGFAYSPALRALARRHGRWTAALLDRYVADPEQVAPGTAMSFHGMRSPAERRDLLAFLRTLQPPRPR